MDFLNLALGISVLISSIAFFIFVITYSIDPYLQNLKEQARKKRSLWRKNIESRLQKLEENERKNKTL